MMNWLASVGTNFNNIQTLHQVGPISGPFDNAHQDPGHHAPLWKPLFALPNRSRHRTQGDHVLINYAQIHNTTMLCAELLFVQKYGVMPLLCPMIVVQCTTVGAPVSAVSKKAATMVSVLTDRNATDVVALSMRTLVI
ncbi:uncharacterized protein NPIL_684181 [Nephila pilipes]|uniref:Uncharacterized protein n=1 Tax=Nephila pilipes TaxID=299642 RepID=A0A8X6T1J6_NEPPI|nr:uncharacterized protein NPIL_684181 [Nephila pilipes]